MQLYFIRHGQSVNNAHYERTQSMIGRDVDPELTEAGRKQVDRLGQFLANSRGASPSTHHARMQNVDGFSLTHVYASPMIRAMDTAIAVAAAFTLRPVVWEDLHEVGGMWQSAPETEERLGLPGPNRAFFEERYPHFVLPEHWNGEGWWNRPYEDDEVRMERGRRFWKTLREHHNGTDDRVAVVSHGGFYNTILAALLGLPLRSGIWFAINNVGITRIDFIEDRIRLAYQNRVDFLPPELVT